MVPDPECIHLTHQHAEVIRGLAYGILERKGYLVLTAEAGMGKTTALRTLSNLLAESDVVSCIIFSPTLTASEFLELALLNFGFRNIPASKAQRIKLLEGFLFKSDEEGKIIALIVDEAHQLSPEALEEIRLLGNFETDRKLLQIVLAGQNQLNEKLNLPELWQLKQRVTLRLSLKRLDREAVDEFIRFRWGLAGGEEPIPFSPAAVDAIASWSNGVPRLINAICDHALLVAFSESVRSIGVETVREACKDLSLPTPPITENGSSFSAVRSAARQPEPPRVPPQETSPEEEAVGDRRDSPQPSAVKRWLRIGHTRRPLRSKTGILQLGEP